MDWSSFVETSVMYCLVNSIISVRSAKTLSANADFEFTFSEVSQLIMPSIITVDIKSEVNLLFMLFTTYFILTLNTIGYSLAK